LVSIKELYYGARPTKSQDLYWVCRCLSRQYHFLSIVQIGPCRRSPRHSATDGLSNFVMKIYSRFAFAASWGRGAKKLFTWAPNWLSAALRVAAVLFGGTSVLREVGLCFVLGHIQRITLDYLELYINIQSVPRSKHTASLL